MLVQELRLQQEEEDLDVKMQQLKREVNLHGALCMNFAKKKKLAKKRITLLFHIPATAINLPTFFVMQ